MFILKIGIHENLINYFSPIHDNMRKKAVKYKTGNQNARAVANFVEVSK